MAKNHGKSIVTAFLEAHCENKDLARRAVEALGPLFTVAETGKYRLSVPSSLNAGEIRAAIERATLCICDDVKFIRMAKLAATPLPAWQTDEEYLNHVDVGLHWCRRDVLMNELGTSVLVGIAAMLDDAMMQGVHDAFVKRYGRLRDEVDINLFRRVKAAIITPPVYLIAFAIAGDEKGVADMAALVPLLTKAVPFGETSAEFGTWYVLCA